MRYCISAFLPRQEEGNSWAWWPLKNVMVGMVCSPSLRVESFSFFQQHTGSLLEKPLRGPSPTAKSQKLTSLSSPPTAPPSAPRRSRPTGSPTHPTASEASGAASAGACALARPLKAGATRVGRRSGDSVTLPAPRPSPSPGHLHPLCAWTFPRPREHFGHMFTLKIIRLQIPPGCVVSSF